MDTKIDELAILKYLYKMQENGEVGEVFVKLVSNKDVDIYVEDIKNTKIGTLVKIESSLYIKRELSVKSVTRKGYTIKALLNNEITVFIKIITPDEVDKFRSDGKES